MATWVVEVRLTGPNGESKSWQKDRSRSQENTDVIPTICSSGAGVYASAVAAEINTTRLRIRITRRRSRGRSLPECMPGRPRKPVSMLRGGRRNARRAPPEG
jgi:hypothetical protein